MKKVISSMFEFLYRTYLENPYGQRGRYFSKIIDCRYTNTDFFRFYLSACIAQAGWKPNPGEGIPGQKAPGTLPAQLYPGFYPKTIMR
ncbi:MAG: hypothetical protein MRK02_10560 [Candidatus Scalindua sp.]|nr:hypothetical protein [Candidatus Scalindua sp.]